MAILHAMLARNSIRFPAIDVYHHTIGDRSRSRYE